ncbi:MAG TPA: lysophospholipid acyltransferase family protein [Gammaproteobacteria bacterium]|nr:lysophospholipid acyltransferase family protein [Gammaproteobacteria bacterium]
MADAPAGRAVSPHRHAAVADLGWRWIGTALSYAVFGLGSVVLGLVAVPLVTVAIRDTPRRVACVRSLIGGAMRFFIRFAHGIRLMDWHCEGLERARAGESYLIVANHPTLIDAVFLLAQFPQADCVVKAGMVRNPFTRQLVRAADYIPNADPVALLETSVERLVAGRSLILFPEGTRTAPGRLPALKPGAAAVAVRSGRRCLPVVIRCEPPTLSKSDPWYRIPRRRPHFSLAVQPPVAPSAVLDETLESRYAHRAFNAWLEAYFAARLEGVR